MITIHYIDDFGHQHLTFVKSLKEVKFYQDRFGGTNVTIDTNSFSIKAEVKKI